MQTAERPRFRQDLVAEPIEDGSARFIDVADPDSGQLFRFYEVEYSLACAMDGERDIAGIVRWAEEELGLKPSANEVRTVISTLGSLGYLESGKAAAAAATAQPTRPQPEADNEATQVSGAYVDAAPTRPTPQPPARPTPQPPAAAKKPAPEQPAPKKQPAPAPAEAAFNRWDQPTAMGDSDEYFEQVAASKADKAAKAPAGDVELGNAGARGVQVAQDMPKGGDLELGAPGARGAAASARGGRGADVELGKPGAADVSTDLVADMAISPADVKAAVRASQVMKSVDVPPELAAELEPAKPAAKQPAKAQPRAASQPARADNTPPPKKIDMPTERPVISKAPTAPSHGPSPLLLALLALVILGAGGFLLWKFVLNKPKDTATTGQVTPTPPPPPMPTPLPPPPVETAKLVTEQPAPEEIKPTAAVQIATIVASDTVVKAGDPIAKLVGFKPSGDKVATLEKELKIYKDDVAKFEKARDTAANEAAKKAADVKVTGLNKMIVDRETKLVVNQAELDKFLIKAPADGKVTTVAKANGKVTPTDIIATLQRDPVLVATFKSAGEVTTDAKVLLAVKGTDQKLSCTVVATGGDGTKIACPAAAAAEGAEVTFAGLDPNAGETPADGAAGDKPADGAAGDKPADGAAAGDKPADGAAAGDKPADGAAAGDKPDAAPAPAPAPKAPPRPRPRPRPQPKATPPADKPNGEKLFPPPGDKPVEPAAAPTPTPTPPPSSGAL